MPCRSQKSCKPCVCVFWERNYEVVCTNERKVYREMAHWWCPLIKSLSSSLVVFWSLSTSRTWGCLPSKDDPPQRQHTGQIWKSVSSKWEMICGVNNVSILLMGIILCHLAWQQSLACLASNPPSVREIFRHRKKSWWQRPCHQNIKHLCDEGSTHSSWAKIWCEQIELPRMNVGWNLICGVVFRIARNDR